MTVPHRSRQCLLLIRFCNVQQLVLEINEYGFGWFDTKGIIREKAFNEILKEGFWIIKYQNNF